MFCSFSSPEPVVSWSRGRETRGSTGRLQIKPSGSGDENVFRLKTKGVFLSVNPKTDFRSKKGFRVPFGKSKSGFLIWRILFEKGFPGFEIRRIQIQISGLVIYAVPFTVDPKLVR